MRPWVTNALRYDLGDYADSVAYELGGGLDLETDAVSLSLSGRTQLGGDGAFGLASWDASLSYGHGGDGTGLTLGAERTAGADAFDPFAERVTLPSEDAADRRSLSLKAGYGLLYGPGVLTPYGRFGLADGAMSSAEGGLKWRGGGRMRNLDLGSRHRCSPGGDGGTGEHYTGVTAGARF